MAHRFVPTDGLDRKITARVSSNTLKQFRIWCVENDTTTQKVLNLLVSKLLDGEITLPEVTE